MINNIIIDIKNFLDNIDILEDILGSLKDISVIIYTLLTKTIYFIL